MIMIIFITFLMCFHSAYLVTHPSPQSPAATELFPVPMTWAFSKSQLDKLLLVLFALAECTECRSTALCLFEGHCSVKCPLKSFPLL